MKKYFVNHNVALGIGICAIIFCASVATGQNGPRAKAAQDAAATQTPLAALYDCAQKTNDAERLACFDAQVAALKAKEASSDVVVIDAPRVAQMRREAFGFNLPSLPKLGLPKLSGLRGGDNAAQQADEERQVMAVTRISNQGGRATLTMENGQVWQLVEAEEINVSGRPPYSANIRSASFGSFLLSFEGRNKGYRVRRVE
ncbi:MAG: hypothetical protein FD163_657 [Hyphomonadaceae bacterium]|nr:MAG: hypothetical protein FD163_657 [Hyphomonadaceae bacterium]